MFSKEDFLKRVELIKRSSGIEKVKRSNDTFRRRIVILIVDEFLRSEGDIHRAFLLEANLYSSLQKHNFTCNPTPEEIRMREFPTGKRLDPLKLVSKNVKPEEEKPYPLSKAIIKILFQEKEDNHGVSTDYHRRGAPQTFRHLQKDSRLFKKQAGASLYRTDKV